MLKYNINNPEYIAFDDDIFTSIKLIILALEGGPILLPIRRHNILLAYLHNIIGLSLDTTVGSKRRLI